MREISNQEYSMAFSKATDFTKKLLSSTKLYDCIESIQSEADSQFNASLLLLPIGNYFLELITLDELLSELAHFNVTDPYGFLTKVKACVNDVQSQPISNPVSLETGSSQKNVNVLNSEIMATEKQLESLHTVRTMSQDMSAIKPGSDVVYQSNQADILARYNIPQPEVTSPPTEPPRWDSDSAK